MLAYLVGFLVLVGLFKLGRRLRARCDGCSPRGRCGHRSRRWGWQRWLFRELNASPEQEQALRNFIEEIQRATEGAHKEWAQSRAALARAFAEESFDETVIPKAYARLEIEAQQVRDRLAESMRQVHESLSPPQRRRLAALMSRGA
jgi:Spy/CpxP family protein refolding chaperone